MRKDPDPIAEFMDYIKDSTEEEAKQWLARNLGRFDRKTRDGILLAFCADARRLTAPETPTLGSLINWDSERS